VGTCRRELLDHVIVLGERHLKRLLGDYVAYYNAERVHTCLEDSPMGAPAKPGLRRAQRWPRSLAWAASTIDTHGEKKLDSVALRPPEARDEF
jgi:hypothetical protein